MQRCASCGKSWPDDSEPGISVEWSGECQWCRLGPTNLGRPVDHEAQAAALRAERDRRWRALTYRDAKDYSQGKQ